MKYIILVLWTFSLFLLMFSSFPFRVECRPTRAMGPGPPRPAPLLPSASSNYNYLNNNNNNNQLLLNCPVLEGPSAARFNPWPELYITDITVKVWETPIVLEGTARSRSEVRPDGTFGVTFDLHRVVKGDAPLLRRRKQFRLQFLDNPSPPPGLLPENNKNNPNNNNRNKNNNNNNNRNNNATIGSSPNKSRINNLANNFNSHSRSSINSASGGSGSSSSSVSSLNNNNNNNNGIISTRQLHQPQHQLTLYQQQQQSRQLQLQQLQQQQQNSKQQFQQRRPPSQSQNQFSGGSGTSNMRMLRNISTTVQNQNQYQQQFQHQLQPYNNNNNRNVNINNSPSSNNNANRNLGLRRTNRNGRNAPNTFSRTPSLTSSSTSLVNFNSKDNSNKCLPPRATVKTGRKYYVFAAKVDNHFIAVFSPELANKRNTKALESILCKGCGQAPSVVAVAAKDVQLKVKERLRLRCRLRAGNPVPVLTWYKDGRPVNLTDTRFRLRPKRRQSILVIRKAKEIDAGVYKCEAKNVFGSAHAIVRVSLQPASSSSTPNRPPAPPNKSTSLKPLSTRPSSSKPVGTTPTTLWPLASSECPFDSYCLNGGTCSYYETIGEYVCQCAEGYKGQRCANKDVPTSGSMYLSYFCIFGTINPDYPC